MHHVRIERLHRARVVQASYPSLFFHRNPFAAFHAYIYPKLATLASLPARATLWRVTWCSKYVWKLDDRPEMPPDRNFAHSMRCSLLFVPHANVLAVSSFFHILPLLSGITFSPPKPVLLHLLPPPIQHCFSWLSALPCTCPVQVPIGHFSFSTDFSAYLDIFCFPPSYWHRGGICPLHDL